MKSPDRDAADELLPCPFCGPGQSICDTWFDDLAQRWRVGCGRCGASSGTNQDILAVIASWNRRPDASELATLRRRVAEMRAQLQKVVVFPEYDSPGDAPEFCGYWCDLCKTLGGKTAESVEHTADCLLSPPTRKE